MDANSAIIAKQRLDSRTFVRVDHFRLPEKQPLGELMNGKMPQRTDGFLPTFLE